MSLKMNAQVFYEPNIMKYEKIDIPVIDDNEILVKLKACGICGSDISYYFGRSPLETSSGKGPLVLGHEMSGEIVALGKKAKDMKIHKEGDKVIVNPAQNCNACPSCYKGYVNLCENPKGIGVSVNGGFAEYIKVNHTHIYQMPQSLTFEEAAFVEPLSCATYGVENLKLELGDFVVIIGSGTIGLLMTQLIKNLGAGKVALIGIFDYPLELGKKLGADFVINTLNKKSPYYTDDLKQKILELNNSDLAQRVIVPTSAKVALQQALEISGRRSTVVYFGLPGEKDKLEVPVLNSITSDKTIRFSWLAPFTWPRAIKALETGKVDVKQLISHRFKLEELIDGIKFMDSESEEKIKAMVTL